VEQTESIPVRDLFSRTMQVLDHLSKEASPQERIALRRAMTTLRTSLPMAEKAEADTPALDVVSQLRLAAGIVEPQSSDQAALKEWGADLVERRRAAAGLSRAVLAERAGHFGQYTAQRGNRAPGADSYNDHAPSVGAGAAHRSEPHRGTSVAAATAGAGLSPNCWLTPEYDALKLHGELTMLLNGRGGELEQTYLYLDPSSAADWYAIASHELYTRARMLMPMNRVARAVSRSTSARWAWM
jgi:hypothetical protein